MARGAASPGDDSSLSGFSSDEDMADVSNLPSVSSVTHNVHVEVLDEDEETAPKSAPTVSQTGSEASTTISSVQQCCQEAVHPILQTKNLLDVQYEAYSTAIGHITWHWPNSETITDPIELESALQAYHTLRADVYKTFQHAFPLTEDMYMQWISDATARGDDTRELQMLFELSVKDYWSVPLTLQYLRFLKENGEDQELERAMNKAQATLGIHFTRGHEIWALCRELVTEKFDEMDNAELQKEQAIRELFCKQMELPLDQNDLVMSEFRAWDAYNTRDTEGSGSCEEASKRQNKLFAPLMKKLRGFEVRISAAPGTEDATAPEQAWQQYLNFVKHQGDKKTKSAKKRKSDATGKGTKQAKSSQKLPPAKRAKLTSISEESEAASTKVDEAKTLKNAKKKAHESLTNEHTLFLSNVSKDASKEDVEALFQDIPTLKDVRLVVKMRGERAKSRGMAYVQFMDDAGVEAGLKRNGSLLDGHPLRVERSKPPPTSASTPANKSPGGESFWKTDPLTLYIGNQNREGSKEQVTEEQLQKTLQQAMQSAGELVVVTRVSILKDRHGKLKNYGLVEVAEPSQVTFCLDHVGALQEKLGEQVTMKPSRFSISHILDQQEKQQEQKQKRKAATTSVLARLLV
ncbi:hypothetical protein PHMEG_00023650 [Phytophthora megakarya]|uniref:RRM domain-containing protein n=1 Tax=Phytophthora megakarya TaxID=4795 RepID=A0A225VI40_9STRA|nr:hypothetical protein PHMEG_00023650 [Phytophthora megakarya]